MVTKIDLEKIPFKNILILVLGVAFLLLLADSCYNQSSIELAEKTQKTAIKKAENRIEELEKANKTIAKEKEVSVKEALKFQADNQKLQSELQKNKIAFQKKKEAVKSFTSSEIVDHYVDRYQLPNHAKTTEKGTEITDTLAYLNITDLITLDELKVENQNLIGQSKNYLSIIDKKDNIIQLTENEKTNLNSMLVDKDLIIQAKDTLIDSEKYKTKKERRAKRFWKVAAIGIGAFTIYQQAK
jgi:hypothetical protein